MVEPGTILNQQPQRYAILPTTARLKSVDSPPCYLRGKSRHGEMIMSMTTKVLKCHWSQFSLADHFSILNYHPLHRWHSSIPFAQTSHLRRHPFAKLIAKLAIHFCQGICMLFFCWNPSQILATFTQTSYINLYSFLCKCRTQTVNRIPKTT